MTSSQDNVHSDSPKVDADTSMFNKNVMKGKWLEIKGEVQKAWGKLTNDELDKTNGDLKALSGLIQQKYGDAQEANSKQLTEIFDRFKDQKDAAVSSMKNSIKN